MTATQTVELSTSDRAAKRAYNRTVGWYTGCRDDRVQLLTSQRLKGTGDDGRLLVLRSWKHPVTTYTIGVARTGSIITSAVRTIRSDETPSLAPMVSLMGTAVWSICDHPAAGTCSTRPASTPVAPPPGEDGHGLVQVVDLPPAPGVTKPWVATEPTRAKLNTAATRCDKADFYDKSIPYSTTRSFLVPEAGLPSAFGLTETLGRFRSAKAADSVRLDDPQPDGQLRGQGHGRHGGDPPPPVHELRGPRHLERHHRDLGHQEGDLPDGDRARGTTWSSSSASSRCPVTPSATPPSRRSRSAVSTASPTSRPRNSSSRTQPVASAARIPDDNGGNKRSGWAG